jgi:PAS domain S-box-containing protein
MTASPLSSAGIALLCNAEGRVLEILGDQAAWGDRFSVGRMFGSGLATGSLAKGLSFLQHIRKGGAAFGWELQLSAADGRGATVSFNGCTVGDRVLILGGISSREMRGFLDDLMRMQNEQLNGFRSGLKEKTLKETADRVGEHEPYNELSRLNNELANAQREAAKRNVELLRLVEEAHAARELAEAANLALHESEAQFRSLVEGAPDAIFVQTNERFSYLNSVACRLFGADSPGELLGEPFRDRVNPSSRAFIEARMDAPNLMKEPLSRYESVWLRLDGQPVPVDTSSVPIHYQGVDSALVFARDITEKKAVLRRGKELEIVAAKAEASSKAKSAFLSTMSHEIRTPMNAILGYSQLLLSDPQLAAGARAKLSIIIGSGKDLLRIINDVLDMATIEAGRVQFAPVVFNLRHLVADLAAEFRTQANAKALQLEVSVGGVQLESIVGDEERIRQLLTNLLTNAVRYTERGRINLHVSLDNRTRTQLWLSATVEDTGIGITPEEEDKLFQPFAQGERSQNIQHGGTGLGLAISRGVAKLLGGDLSFSRASGGGSLFHFEIPIAAGDDAERANELSAQHDSGKRELEDTATKGVSSEQLRGIAEDLLERLREAVLMGDKTRMDKLILTIEEEGSEQSGRALQKLADAYQYDRLTQLLEKR